MSYPGVPDDLKRCSRCEQPGRVLLFPLVLEFNMRAAGMTYRQNRTDLEKIVRMNCETVERFGYDWALIFPDDYVEWEPFGLDMFDEEDLPVTPRKYLPATAETVNKMVFPDFTRDGRMPLHLEAIRRVKEKLGESTCVAGRVAPPFGSLALLFGVEPLMLGLYDNPGFLKEAMNRISDYIILWGRAQRDAGADALWVGDCLSASSFISPEIFTDFCTPYAEKVIGELKKTGLFLIYHACETSIPHIELEARLSADAVNLGEGIEILEVKKQLKQKKCLMGNLDPIRVLRDGTVEQIRTETSQMIEKNKAAGAYIFSTSEGITQDTPQENITAMMEAAKKCAVYG